MSANTSPARSAAAASIPSWMGPAALSLFLAFVSSYFAVQRGQALIEQRVAAAESKIDTVKTERERALTELKAQIVPRSEHEAHWKADEQFRALLLQRLEAIQTDVREIRNK